MQNDSIIVYGEVLFDHFPNGRKILGGAPFNVAWHLQAFGQQPCLISRIGKDSDGNQIKSEMQRWGIGVDYLQEDSLHPTGQVEITISHGEPSYHIVPNQAYDFIEQKRLEYLNGAGFLYHGTLAARSPVSRQTLTSLANEHQGKIFIDVNLRPPWWDLSDVSLLIREADWLKLNLNELKALEGNIGNIKQCMEKLLTQHRLEGVIVTCGETGALALDKIGRYFSVSPVWSDELVDTVGAGDAFSAVMLLGLNLGWELHMTMERAQQFASALTCKTGAIVDDWNFYEPFIKDWSL